MKKLLSFLFTTLISISLFAQTYSTKQMFPAGHWIYDAIYTLSMEAGQITMADTAPLPADELKLYLSYIDYERLSNNGKILYDRVSEFFNTKPFVFDLKPVEIGVNLSAEPMLFYNSNKNIDRSFANDYTGHITNTYGKSIDDNGNDYFVKNYLERDYGAGSNFQGNYYSTPILQYPLFINFNDIAFFEGDFYHGNNFWTLQDLNSFTNYLIKGNDEDTHWPNYVYGTVGYKFDNGLGITLQVAKEGFQFGRSQTGSVIYNSTFETDSYLKLDLYTHNFKYNAEVVEVTNKKFLYLHSFEFTAWKRFKFALIEGTMINGPFEFRYFNPLMNFHSFASWNQYMTDEEEAIYGTAHASSYVGVTFDVIPFKNSRIYLNACMNEFQLGGELNSVHGRTIPNGLGFQSGFEYSMIDKNAGWYTFGIEGVYTFPYLYYKSGADWSLYRERYNVQKRSYSPICSWIGSPFGPDAAALQLKVDYKNPGKYKWEGKYLFVAHGENSFGLFNQKYKDLNGNVWDAYYPSTLYCLGILSNDEAYKLARRNTLTGTIQLTNELSISGEYTINKHLAIEGLFMYTFVFNNKNIKDNFEQGVEMAISFNTTLF